VAVDVDVDVAVAEGVGEPPSSASGPSKRSMTVPTSGTPAYGCPASSWSSPSRPLMLRSGSEPPSTWDTRRAMLAANTITAAVETSRRAPISAAAGTRRSMMERKRCKLRGKF
jgi:hypothetical protein